MARTTIPQKPKRDLNGAILDANTGARWSKLRRRDQTVGIKRNTSKYYSDDPALRRDGKAPAIFVEGNEPFEVFDEQPSGKRPHTTQSPGYRFIPAKRQPKPKPEPTPVREKPWKTPVLDRYDYREPGHGRRGLFRPVIG